MTPDAARQAAGAVAGAKGDAMKLYKVTARQEREAVFYVAGSDFGAAEDDAKELAPDELRQWGETTFDDIEVVEVNPGSVDPNVEAWSGGPDGSDTKVRYLFPLAAAERGFAT